MKRLLFLSVVALLGTALPSWAGTCGACCNKGIHCEEPPAPDCQDCSDPCCHRHHFCTMSPEHAHQLIGELCSGCCCDRIKAVKKLGHADFCSDPEVLQALVRALLCDTCWEVRQTAAWSIAHQGARTRLGVMALYLSSKLDHHYMVRDAAVDALEVLLVCRRDCYKDLFAAADELAKTVKADYDPTKGKCLDLADQCFALCGATAAVPGMPMTVTTTAEVPPSAVTMPAEARSLPSAPALSVAK